MTTFVTVIHCVTCVLLVLVILIQSGKGAEISASFSGSSQTVFGSSGGANFFTHFTQVAAGIFMCTSLALTILGGQSKKSLFEGASTPAAQTAPAPVGGAMAPGAKAPPASAPPIGTTSAAAPAASAPVTPGSEAAKPAAH
jgi:preprotein translocase subunit SecG